MLFKCKYKVLFKNKCKYYGTTCTKYRCSYFEQKMKQEKQLVHAKGVCHAM